jgi:rubrerythrin
VAATVPTLNPWQEQGMPLEQQYRTWKDRVRAPYHKREVEAYTRARIILMNGIENEAWAWSHNFARCTGNKEIKALLAKTRMADQQQQTTINYMHPADQTPLETSIAYEQVAIDMTAYLARNEPDPYVREAFHFGLLEDFDHLYRYAEMLDFLEGQDPETIVQGQTDIFPGRATIEHHNDPEQRLLRHYEKNRGMPLSKIHILTLLSGEQQTYNFYKEHGNYYGNQMARELYGEISEVEEEHVTFYESLMDPTETPLQRQLLHNMVQVYNYFHCLETETDQRIKPIWEEFLQIELGNLQLWGGMLRKYEGIEPQELFGDTLTVEFKFRENKEYVRRVLEKQKDLRVVNGEFVDVSQVPEKWPSYAYREMVNADGVPSEELVTARDSLPRPVERVGDELLERARAVAMNGTRVGKVA